MTTRVDAGTEALAPSGAAEGQWGAVAPQAMPGRLGVFQRAMLLWNEWHAYNAVHVVRIAAPLEPGRLEGLVNERLERLGLTGLVVDQAHGRFVYKGGPARAAVRVLAGGGDPAARVDAEVQAQLNARFPVGEEFTPVRVFAVPAGDSFYLGLVYCHFVSDAHPIVTILTSIAVTYLGAPAPAPAANVYPGVRKQMLPLILKGALRYLISMPGFVLRLSRSVKPRYIHHMSGENAFAFFRLPAEEFKALHDATRGWGVTLNDAFLAALVKAVAPQAAMRPKGRRNLIAISSIASVRKDVPDEAAMELAPLLSSFVVFHPLPADEPFEEVARAIHAQASAIKRRRLYVRTLVELAFSRLLLRHTSQRWREKFYRQNYPLWGGVTSINLDRLSGGGDAGMSGYFRAVSTGPVCPLVFSVTTHDSALNVGVSYRTAAFSGKAVEEMISGFRRCLCEPARS